MAQIKKSWCNEVYILKDGSTITCRLRKKHTIPHHGLHPITKIPIYWSVKVKVS
jgi:hypothetical protein